MPYRNLSHLSLLSSDGFQVVPFSVLDGFTYGNRFEAIKLCIRNRSIFKSTFKIAQSLSRSFVIKYNNLLLLRLFLHLWLSAERNPKFGSTCLIISSLWHLATDVSETFALLDNAQVPHKGSIRMAWISWIWTYTVCNLIVPKSICHLVARQ